MRLQKGGVKLKSVKRGRGPSFMGGVGSLVMVAFGILWTVMAYNMANIDDGLGFGFDANPLQPAFNIFPFFGIIFIVVGLASAIYNFVNATRKNRFSELDITDGDEEPDPLNQRFGEATEERSEPAAAGFCPYCGQMVQAGFAYCAKCGKKL